MIYYPMQSYRCNIGAEQLHVVFGLQHQHKLPSLFRIASKQGQRFRLAYALFILA